ncbi:MAG: STAS domain-containing protein [Bacteroidales bacterium]|nr:STAS domain-containing protein [Muribaculaceae bacterium]MDO4970705.1 STAS domain-containing protein [Bacteroidales bacterium]
MEFKFVEKENELEITLAGRLDTMSSEDINAKVTEMASKMAGKMVTVDCSDLEYISSSGIRLLLYIRKSAAPGQTTLKGVRPEIMQILKVTKLDSMFTIA